MTTDRMMYAHIGDQIGGHRPHYEVCARGEALPQSKLTDEQVRKIRQEHADKQAEIERLNAAYDARALAKKYGVSKATITKVLTYQTWRHVK